MPTIKELGLKEGQRTFVYSVEKRIPSGTLGGLHLTDALKDPKTEVVFGLVEVMKHGEKYSTMFKLLCATRLTGWNTASPDFPGVRTKDIIFIHNLYPHYIVDGVGPILENEICDGVEMSEEHFQKNIPIINHDKETVGELVVDNERIYWNIDLSELTKTASGSF